MLQQTIYDCHGRIENQVIHRQGAINYNHNDLFSLALSKTSSGFYLCILPFLRIVAFSWVNRKRAG